MVIESASALNATLHASLNATLHNTSECTTRARRIPRGAARRKKKSSQTTCPALPPVLAIIRKEISVPYGDEGS